MNEQKDRWSDKLTEEQTAFGTGQDHLIEDEIREEGATDKALGHSSKDMERNKGC